MYFFRLRCIVLLLMEKIQIRTFHIIVGLNGPVPPGKYSPAQGLLRPYTGLQTPLLTEYGLKIDIRGTDPLVVGEGIAPR